MGLAGEANSARKRDVDFIGELVAKTARRSKAERQRLAGPIGGGEPAGSLHG